MKTFDAYHSGKRFLVEECQKISINTSLRKAREQMKKTLIASVVELGNISIELTPSNTAFGGKRYWFKCPKCQGRVGTLFVHPLSSDIGCRECLNLEYRSRRYKGMVEANARSP